MTTKRSDLHQATALSCYPCLGHNFVPIDLYRLQQFKAEAYADGVDYVFGGKDPNVGSGKIDFTGIDCSGWARTLLLYITHNILDMGDGSSVQGHNLINLGFRCFSVGTVKDYLTHALANDDLFRIGFHWPGGRGGDSIGHVFPLMHNHTAESYGGHGPGERAATHPWFETHCDLIVVIGPMINSLKWNDPSYNPYTNGGK